MERNMSDMNKKEREVASKILDREIDFDEETFVGGGHWEGGWEYIDLKDFAKLFNYLKSINVSVKTD
jgi:hypothetical protein